MLGPSLLVSYSWPNIPFPSPILSFISLSSFTHLTRPSLVSFTPFTRLRQDGGVKRERTE